MKTRADNRRRRELGLIHVAKKRLGLDDAAYRAMLETIGGKRSAADLDAWGRRAVIEHLRRAGFAPAASPGDTRAASEARAKAAARMLDLAAAGAKPQHAMIQSLWEQIVDLGVLDHPAFASVDRFAQKITGIAIVAWLPPAEANKVIEALKSWLKRERAKRRPDK